MKVKDASGLKTSTLQTSEHNLSEAIKIVKMISSCTADYIKLLCKSDNYSFIISNDLIKDVKENESIIIGEGQYKNESVHTEDILNSTSYTFEGLTDGYSLIGEYAIKRTYNKFGTDIKPSNNNTLEPRFYISRNGIILIRNSHVNNDIKQRGFMWELPVVIKKLENEKIATIEFNLDSLFQIISKTSVMYDEKLLKKCLKEYITILLKSIITKEYATIERVIERELSC